MMRAGTKMLPAVCATCGVVGPAKSVAARATHGWTKRGPEQRRRWYCPDHPPSLPAPASSAEWVPARAQEIPPPPSEPFARLRWERDYGPRPEPAPQLSILDALLGKSREKGHAR